MDNCLFCKIVRHEEPSEIVLEDDKTIVIQNKFPKAPIHLLVMPKKHYNKSSVHFDGSDGLYDQLIKKCGEAAQKMGLKDGNYKIIINGSKIGHFAHEHLHLLGGWGPGEIPDLE